MRFIFLQLIPSLPLSARLLHMLITVGWKRVDYNRSLPRCPPRLRARCRLPGRRRETGRSIMASIQSVIKPLGGATQVISPVCLESDSDEMSAAFSLPPLYAAVKSLSFFWNALSRATKMTPERGRVIRRDPLFYPSLLLTTGSEKLSFYQERVGPFLKVRLDKRQKFSFSGSVRPRWLLQHAN